MEEGASGGCVWSGWGEPRAGVGEEGDFYVDLAELRLWGPKGQGEWPPVEGHVAECLCEVVWAKLTGDR